MRDVRLRAYVQFDGRIVSEEALLTSQKHEPRLSWPRFEELEGIKLRHRLQRTEKSEAIKEYALRSYTGLATKIQDMFVREKNAAQGFGLHFKKD